MKIEIRGAIEDIKGSTGITDMGDPDITLRVKVQLSPGAYARIMNLQKQRVPMYLTIGSDQAQMDLQLVAFSGEKDIADTAADDVTVSDDAKSALPRELGILSLKSTEPEVAATGAKKSGKK